jgi:hypothetical protein
MGSSPEVAPRPVLVVSRHGAYALELRRAGLVVLEAAGLDLAALPAISACVVDAVAADTPSPAGWETLVPILSADGAPPTVAVVSRQPPSWLGQLGARAVLVSAPISGRELAARVTSSACREPRLTSAEARVDGVTDIDLSPSQVIDLTDEMDREAAIAVRRSLGVGRMRPVAGVPPAPRGLSMPLRMARLAEVADRLMNCLTQVRALRAVGEALAAAVAQQLAADVAVLVSPAPGAGWSVIAGVGLRPLEWRPMAHAPAVLTLLDARRPILRVEASDDVRQSAVDLPCASRAHLLIARHPGVDVLLVAGREQAVFTRDDVRTLGGLLEAERGFGDALLMRGLAERLLPYLDT